MELKIKVQIKQENAILLVIDKRLYNLITLIFIYLLSNPQLIISFFRFR